MAKDFWTLSNGETARDTGSEYEAPSGVILPIPDGSSVLAMIGGAKWESARNSNGGEHFISLEWTVLEPKEYANRKVWQKLWVNDYDPTVIDQAKQQKKRDSARKMLSAIDANCGAKLAKSGDVPDDGDLAIALCQRPMVVKLRVWEIIEDGKEPKCGNWIVAVSPKTAPLIKVAPKNVSTSTGIAGVSDIDDDVPF